MRIEFIHKKQGIGVGGEAGMPVAEDRLHSDEAEMSCLGSMMLSEKVCRLLLDRGLEEDDFYKPAHQELYSVLAYLAVSQTPIDLVTVKDELVSRGKLRMAGGEDYLLQIAEFVPSAASGEHYGKIVKDYALRRQGIEEREREIVRLRDLEQPVLNGQWGERHKVFELLTLDQVESLDDRAWLVESFLPIKGLGMIYGSPGCGKTFLVLDLAFGLVRGPGLIAREFAVQKECRVVYAAGEKIQGLKVRIKAARKKWGLTLAECSRVRVCNGVPQLYDQSLSTRVAVFIAEMKSAFGGGIDVLIIDTKHTATIGSEENSNSDSGLEIHHAREIQDALGCALIVVHHSGAAGNRERGATAWKGAVDMLLRVDKDEMGSRSMLCEKMGDAPDNFSIAFNLEPVPETGSLAVSWVGRTQPVAKDTRSEVLRILGSAVRPMSAKEVTGLFTIDCKDSAVKKALDRLAAQGEDKTGVSRRESNPGVPLGTKNWYLYSLDPSKIQNASSYKDSDDAAEMEPEDPFADDD